MNSCISGQTCPKHVLKEIVESNYEIHWYNLKNYESKIKHVFYKYIKNKFIDAITK